MKKSLFFSVLALSAIMFSSCNKEIENPVEDNLREVQFTIHAGVPETKTYFEHDGVNNKYVPKWNNGDAIGVFFNTWANDAALGTTFSNTAASGSSATFSGTGTVDANEQTIYAFYPASSFAKAYASKVIGMTIPAVQKPTASSFDPSADILVNVPYDITIDNASVVIDDMQFRRVGSILKVIVTDITSTSKLSGDKIESVVISSDMTNTAFAGRYRYDFANQKAYYDNGSVNEHMATKSDKVTADLSDNPLNLGDAIYLIVNPQTITSGSKITFKVYTDKHEVTKEVTLSSDISFPAGAMAQMTIRIADADTVDDAITEPTGNGWFLVQKASWLKVGDKVVITNKASNGALGAASGAYRTKVNVSVSAGKLTVGDATQFTIVAGNAVGSYAFKDSEDNYLYHSGDKAVGTKADLDDSGSWTISVGAEESVIRNVGSSTYYLQYNSTSPRFTDYTGTQQNVLIYKQYTVPTIADISITATPDHANKKITVTWADVANATNYAVECTGKSTQNIAPGVQTAEFTGLEYDVEYTITVTASAAGYVSSSDTKNVTLIDPSAKTITRLKDTISGVPAAGVTGASESGVYSLTNAIDSDITVTPDGVIVTAASVSSGSVIYSVSENTGIERSGSITLSVAGGNSITVTVSQLAGATVVLSEEFDNDSSSDSSSAISTSTFPNFSGATSKAYKSKYGGIKFGTSSAAGYITSKSLDLSNSFTVKLNVLKYGSDTGKVQVTVGEVTKEITPTTTDTQYTLEFDAATSTSTVKIGTSSKRAYIDNVIIAVNN